MNHQTSNAGQGDKSVSHQCFPVHGAENLYKKEEKKKNYQKRPVKTHMKSPTSSTRQLLGRSAKVLTTEYGHSYGSYPRAEDNGRNVMGSIYGDG